ncbi:MAG: DUF6624 domain-containing protein, partial [Pseudomonadota bacterium]
MKRPGIKAGFLGVVSVLLTAAQEPPQSQSAEPDYPDPPTLVAERIVDGRFEPGNFEYLRGFFPDATPEEQEEYTKLTDWLDQCRKEGRARLDAELTELGATLEFDSYTNASAALCRQVFPGEKFKDCFATYEELETAARQARLVFATLVEAARLSAERVRPIAADYARELEVRPLGDQLVRLAFSWTRVPNDDPRLPHLSEDAALVFNTFLLGEMRRIDHANTLWLKGRVERDGWPKISQVGEKAADMAWLLVQHADADPAFQLKALRLMEPLVAEGEVSKSNYAYLYDRIMLKLAGKQRYATQVTCKDGDRIPRPLE